MNRAVHLGPVVTALVVWAGACALPAPQLTPRVGAQAPDFALFGANGERHRLSEHVESTRAVVLVFYRGHW